MASPKEYAYYLEGNRVGIVERDTAFDNDPNSKDYGPGTHRSVWKSPLSDVTDGLEIKYTYSPQYRIYSQGTVEVNKFYVNGWTVLDGYLTFLRSHGNTAMVDWTAAPYSTVTSGTAGNPAGITSADYIVVGGSQRWNGLHRVKTAGTEGQLVTHTRVKDTLPYWTDQQVDFNTDEEIFDGGAGTLFLANYFSAGDYIWVSGVADSKNDGLFSVASVSKSSASTSSKVVVGTKYYVNKSTLDVANVGLDVENSVTATLLASTDQSDINIFKAHREFCHIRTDVDVLNDEMDEIDLPPYLSKALVPYLKAKMFEDAGDIDRKEYFLKEFRKMLERYENSRISGLRIISAGTNAIR